MKYIANDIPIDPNILDDDVNAKPPPGNISLKECALVAKSAKCCGQYDAIPSGTTAGPNINGP